MRVTAAEYVKDNAFDLVILSQVEYVLIPRLESAHATGARQLVQVSLSQRSYGIFPRVSHLVKEIPAARAYIISS